MLQQQFLNSIKQPQTIEQFSLSELELLVKEYPYFQTAHLLFTKRLFQTNALNYSKQLRKTAVVANSRVVLYELIHKHEQSSVVREKETPIVAPVVETVVKEEPIITEQPAITSPITTTSDTVKVIYINTVTSTQKTVEPVEEKQVIESKEEIATDVQMVQTIENATDESFNVSTEEKINKEIELEISKGIIQSYVETDIIKTPELQKEENKEPVSFTDWLNKVKKESSSIQKETNPIFKETTKEEEKEDKTSKIEKKSVDFEQKRQLIDKIIESDPGRIKLTQSKFFTPTTDAKQSLLENEHLVTETLAKIYALQGNISKAIRAYEILSLKFPQKSVYFASLIEKLKTNK